MLAGIQEARTKQQARTACGVHRISSGAFKGHYGCELWVNLEAAYATTGADHRPHFLQPKNCATLIAEPRVLFVKIVAALINVTVAVLHVPYQDTKGDSVEKEKQRVLYWKRLVDFFVQFPPDIVFVDANGRLGDTSSEAVGTAGYAQCEDDNGRRLHELCFGV